MGRLHGTRRAASAVALLSVLSAAGAVPPAAAPGSFELVPAVEAARAEVGGMLRAITTEDTEFHAPAVDGGVETDFDSKGPQEDLTRVVRGGTPGDFNLYIFAMSWKAECYPTSCTSEAYDHDRVVDAIGLDILETTWPNIQVPEELGGKKYDSFWEHEWTKHGTCTGLSMEAYFATAVSLLQRRFLTPSQLAGNVGGHTTRVELEDAYGGDGMAVLDCKGKVHLNQVYLCLEQDPETHLPGAQVACPPAIVAHDDTCGQDSLEIASFE